MAEIPRFLPLGTPPGQEFESNPSNFTHGQSFYDLLQENPNRKDLQMIPISQNLLRSYFESIVPDGKFPDNIFDLYRVRNYTFYIVRNPRLRDEVILAYGRPSDTPTCESAAFSVVITRDLDETDDRFKVKNRFLFISGIVRDSEKNGRLLRLSYPLWDREDWNYLKLGEGMMSLTNEEAPRFSTSSFLSDQYITNLGIIKNPSIFTPAMREIIKDNITTSFTADSKPNWYYHPKHLGTFWEIHGNEVTFGLKVFRNENPTITVPLSLRKPKELRIPLSR